ncbi:MAG: rhodanese-like domain-containing protein [Pseudomonadota bacterium]
MERAAGIVDEDAPAQCYAELAATERSLLIDVRTRAEWQFVGLPDLAGIDRELKLLEWIVFPQMTPNATFGEQIREVVEAAKPERMFFICRSGQRSLAAAQAAAHVGEEMGISLHCTNVTEGFEGDLDPEGHRGRLNGWKATGLPWRQG